MNREDIERLAREAKGHAHANKYAPGDTFFAFSIDRLEHFVSLVAAAEREEILWMNRENWFETQEDFVNAIRARNNT